MLLRNVLTSIIFANSYTAFSSPVKTPQSAAPNLGEESRDAATPKKAKSTANSAISTSLGSIASDVEGDMTVVTVKLNKKPDWTDVSLEEHGTFLQIKLPKTQIPSSGEFIDGNGPYLKKIATFQLQDEDGALRFFLNMDASKAKLATAAELLGDRLVITFDHKKIEQLVSAPAAKSDNLSADDIVAKTVVDKSLPAPSEQIKASGNENAAADANNGELYSRLAKAAAFCAVLFAGLVALHIFRGRRTRGSSPFRGKAETAAPAMKVLSSISIGQKQKLTLVQVGNQQILLGVGPESVNLITTIGNKPAPANDFSLALESANPQGTVRLKSADDIIPPKVARKPVNSQTIPAKSETAAPRANRVNVAVGDDGIKDHGATGRADDITKMLRERLKNLPPR